MEARRHTTPIRPDDPLEAEKSETIRQLAEASRLTAISSNVRIYRGAQGDTAIAVDEPIIHKPFRRIGYVVTTGPEGEDDFFTAQYWVQVGLVRPADEEQNQNTDPIHITAAPGADGLNYIVPVTNLAELALETDAYSPGGTHLLRPLQFVEIWKADVTGFAGSIYLMNVSPNVVIVVHVQSNGSSGGVYAGEAWVVPGAAINQGSAATASLVGGAGEDCTIVNMQEFGASTHDLTNAANTQQKYFIGVKVGKDLTGKPVYVINGFFNENCEEP